MQFYINLEFAFAYGVRCDLGSNDKLLMGLGVQMRCVMSSAVAL